MPIIVEAVYENGVLKPLKKLKLKDGQKVRIKVELDVSKYYGLERIKRTWRRDPIFLKGDNNALRVQEA
ncbi:DUF104 domain-containing protein [Thermococcus aggregans]|uniref:Antitoxin n=1 Tax=Thermococcus aggregans TaxID=110163 RepID=A0A9E7N0E8_THEAG|nr:antitoxin AF2212-like protein [Thermococcus aggregans]USS41777.1 DUF104 domain-containing protein [Thermococcus aggregans]